MAALDYLHWGSDISWRFAESRAICRYISDKYEKQGTNLFPGETPQQKALVEQWLEVESQNFNPLVTSIVFNIVFGPAVYGVPCDDKAVESSYTKLEAVLDIYEAHLAKGSLYLAGAASSTPNSSRSTSFLFCLLALPRSRAFALLWFLPHKSVPRWMFSGSHY